ncbi:MAG TPA: phytanoyl-CoA dioxygenase family protein [Devosia sp.]|jgi:ectoine hydroxylase-related dioxygenase (phytanoyl-CoA dioxygenase family)|uniref:phytanoyl-CoA dioxygenase family protein n=1 Tax=Devosia sp. TaxID=1871048 RepID=UPI002DDD1EB2|nr:phytanoyl-CoA dioxygenase family protein [Devosia sp.]HEV2514183.1 phytanoyl-CoA dioxygenase family protein [Devosia sp.]
MDTPQYVGPSEMSGYSRFSNIDVSQEIQNQLYQFDLNGYVVVEDAISADLLAEVNALVDGYEKRAGIYKREGEGETHDKEARLKVRFSRIVLENPAFLQVAMNPKVISLIDHLIVDPRMKSTWLDFAGKGGAIGYHSNHTPMNPVDAYFFSGRVTANLVTVVYALKDVPLNGAALDVIPGSHKANYPLPTDVDVLRSMRKQLPLKAGSALVFSHDMNHGSRNNLDYIRRCMFSSFSTGSSANSQGEDGLYTNLFESSPEGTWQKYLLRRPKGDRDSYPRPDRSRWDEEFAKAKE